MAILSQHDLGFTVNIWCLMLQKLQGFFFFFFFLTSSTNIDSLQLCCMKKIPTSFQCHLSLSLLTPAVIDVQTAPAFPYLMCTRLSLMPTFEANRSEPGGGKSRGEQRRFEGKWKAWPKRKKQIRGEADGVREEFGKMFDKKTGQLMLLCFLFGWKCFKISLSCTEWSVSCYSWQLLYLQADLASGFYLKQTWEALTQFWHLNQRLNWVLVFKNWRRK